MELYKVTRLIRGSLNFRWPNLCSIWDGSFNLTPYSEFGRIAGWNKADHDADRKRTSIIWAAANQVKFWLDIG
jgi:hypothetical protein